MYGGVGEDSFFSKSLKLLAVTVANPADRNNSNNKRVLNNGLTLFNYTLITLMMGVAYGGFSLSVSSSSLLYIYFIVFYSRSSVDIA